MNIQSPRIMNCVAVHGNVNTIVDKGNNLSLS